MACEGKTYVGLDEVMMRAIRLDLHQMGMPMSDDPVGVVVNKDFGVEVEYEYVSEHLTLHVRVREKPFFVPCSFIYNRLDQAIERRQNGHDPVRDQ